MAEQILDGDYCSGCGACIGVGKIFGRSESEMEFNARGQLVPIIKISEKNEINEIIKKICPFSDDSYDEDYISEKFFGKYSKDKKPVLGYAYSAYSGNATNTIQRQISSGGGVLTTLLIHLFESKLIDYVVHTKSVSNGKEYFKYEISEGINDLERSHGSHYYPMTMDEMIVEIDKRKGRYVFVGVPCFIRGLKNAVMKFGIVPPLYTFGLVCGHLKTAQFADMIRTRVAGNQDVKNIFFRQTDQYSRANEYRMGVVTKDNKILSKGVQHIPGSNWGESAFKLKSCDFCDDVYNECSDITFGDAWLPKYIKDGRGKNVLLIRNPQIDEIIKKMDNDGEIETESITFSEMLEAQDATIRHRVLGLQHRQEVIKKQGGWVPRKRKIDCGSQTERDKNINELRMLLTEKSKELYAKYQGNIFLYDLQMWKYRRRYLKFYVSKNYKLLPVEIYRVLQLSKYQLLRLKTWLR